VINFLLKRLRARKYFGCCALSCSVLCLRYGEFGMKSRSLSIAIGSLLIAFSHGILCSDESGLRMLELNRSALCAPDLLLCLLDRDLALPCEHRRSRAVHKQDRRRPGHLLQAGTRHGSELLDFRQRRGAASGVPSERT